MRHSEKAALRLHKHAAERYPVIRDAMQAYVTAHKSMVDATDVIDAIQCCARTILAAENLRNMAEAYEASARGILAAVMDDTGCPTIAVDHHVVMSKRTTPKAIVMEEQDIPREFFVTMEPRLDKKALLAALKRRDVPGAHLSNGGEPYLSISARKP